MGKKRKAIKNNFKNGKTIHKGEKNETQSLPSMYKN